MQKHQSVSPYKLRLDNSYSTYNKALFHILACRLLFNGFCKVYSNFNLALIFAILYHHACSTPFKVIRFHTKLNVKLFDVCSVYNIISIHYTCTQLHASSLSEAKKMAKVLPTGKEILVGGKHLFTLTDDDIVTALRLLQVDNSIITDFIKNACGGVSVRSVFLPHQSFQGTLYRVGEHCQVIDGDQQFVLKISKIFSFQAPPENIYCTFVKGLQLVNFGVDVYSDNVIVQNCITCSNHDHEAIVLVKVVARKVMLYPHNETGILLW